MFNETANDLAQACTELAREGKKFLTIWATKLKRHALVEGIPRHRLRDAEPAGHSARHRGQACI